MESAETKDVEQRLSSHTKPDAVPLSPVSPASSVPRSKRKEDVKERQKLAKERREEKAKYFGKCWRRAPPSGRAEAGGAEFPLC
ncbi:hypothetical protein D4764_10G0010940 [Takifugu flavidus]|uniref:Uncharacterized protein n=1 Tax=Takifugu flavidus TaxID=433684 RepID=A0A5C6PJY4_9TELE|nr:hypothetical protein D4764_10G0010940 [Takifugu flavidus]